MLWLLCKLENLRIGSSRWGCNYGDACFPNRCLPKAISSSFQLQIIHGLKRWILDFLSFQMTDFGSLVHALYSIEEGISRGLWADSSSLDSKRKKSGSGSNPSDVGTIGMMGHRPLRRPPTQRQFSDTSYQMIQHDQYRPAIHIRPAGLAYLHPSPQPVYATQAS
ncbi:hypothetical protein CK203_054842 [Vitis vinifera]|uniref:Uncharacterized protein n=1 Tax=Vitis vinifera TaxID=29760 RepID=A0A438H4H1_VITVI|nr:hypothetical protein CK203_054842 [Vitis vinifera]